MLDHLLRAAPPPEQIGMRVALYSLKTIAFLSLLSAAPCQAARFANSYVTFDLPDDWKCIQEQSEWVCKPLANADGKVTMIVILAAKLVGPGDSPQLYTDHLNKEALKDGVSMAILPQQTLIGQSIWLDATLKNSEIRYYKTRYLARTEANIAVLITFSAHRLAGNQGQIISDALARSVQITGPYALPDIQPGR